uniref:Gastrin-releasing peptide n=1 Tax=Salarias fasciatus TaxID=181472 RepID=A0A672HQJ8_SALFA
MGGVCLCWSWTCRPVRPLFLLLAAVPVLLHSSQSPAAAGGKIYSRGNHWAVGHLMGKKSIESLREGNIVSGYLSPSETARVTELLMEALLLPKNQKPMISPRESRLRRLHSSWRGLKHLREVSVWIPPSSLHA